MLKQRPMGLQARCNTEYMHIIRAVPLRPMNLTPGRRLGPPFAALLAREGDGSE